MSVSCTEPSPSVQSQFPSQWWTDRKEAIERVVSPVPPTTDANLSQSATLISTEISWMKRIFLIGETGTLTFLNVISRSLALERQMSVCLHHHPSVPICERERLPAV